jgi:nitric oxide reductase activation protein
VQLQGAKSGLTPNSTVALIATTPTAAASAETSDDAPAAVATSTITQVQKDPIAVLKREIETLKQKIDRRNLKISKVSERYDLINLFLLNTFGRKI